MRNVKRALSLVLVLALALTMCVVGAGAAKYSDVPSTYAYSSEVQFLSDIEVITGYPDGTFKPENTITRGEAAAVIFRTLAGKESAAQNYQGGTQFSDVSADHWASGYVNFCTEMGIINGYPDGTFKPDQTVTYAEYVTMLARALGLDIGKDLSYPYGYIAEATVEGINYGVDLGANDPAPRGSVAKLTYNAIFDATYKRIANNIYTTKKPTIAENVLKLKTMEGVISSIQDYDWTGSGTAGEGKIRLDYADDLSNDFTNYNGNYGDTWTGDYTLDNSYLGKEVKIWYKEDPVTASGQKIYAVIEKQNTTATLPHIVIRGLIGDDLTKHQITYALNDVDYKAKLDNQVILVENNEAWGNLDFETAANIATSETTLANFVGVRAWLPVTWTFMDTDSNGKYDIIHRMVYGFDKVSSINSDVITLENFGSIDRSDNGKVYAWNDGLEDVGEDDWVIYYSDGAVSAGSASPVATYLAMAAGPQFEDSGLYGDTDYATFQKMDFATLAVEKISDHDRYVFDGTTFRTWSANGSYYKDLVSGTTINAEIGDEFDLWYTKQFGGIIASAESADMSTGNFIVLYGVESSVPDRPNANFTVYGFDEKGNDVDFVIKGNKTKGLKEYFAGDGETRTANNVPLNYANLSASLAAATATSGMPYALCEYKMNSANQITELNVYGNISETVNTSGDYKTYFNTKTQVFNKKYNIQDNALVFAINGTTPSNETVRVLTGTFPKVSGTSADVVGYKLKDGEDVKALVTVISSGHFSSSDTEDIIGYLRSVDRFSDHYEYTIAYGDNAATVLSSRTGDIDTIVADDDLFTTDDWTTQMGRKAGMIMFDVTASGNIENMRALTTAAMTTTETNADSEYLAAYVVEKVDSSKKTVTLRPITNANVNASAKPISGADLWNAAEVAGIFAEYDAGVGEVFSLASNANVFVINPNTTNQAGTTLGSLGDLQKATTDAAGNITRGMVVTLAYNGDDDEIIAIFANKEIVK